MKKTIFVAEVAVFSALVFVATIVIAIPSVSTSGYVNLVTQSSLLHRRF